MIVKNERENLGAALGCVKSYVDEIIVCDTGSTDNTIEIARQFGASIVAFPWCDDFSAARNAAIESSTCDVILWLDADDRITPASMRLLQNAWRSNPLQCGLVKIISPRDNQGSAEVWMQPRFFPRMPGIRFERRIHEQIITSAQKKGIPLLSHESIEIIHTGYESPELRKNKAERNNALLLKELAVSGPQAHLYRNIGDSYVVMEQSAKAVEAYQQCLLLSVDGTMLPEAVAQTWYALAAIHHNTGDRARSRNEAMESLRVDPSEFRSHVILGLLDDQDGLPDSAMQHYAEVLQCRDTPKRVAVNTAMHRRLAFERLGRHLITAGHTEDACNILTAASSEFPQIETFWNLLGDAHLTAGRTNEAQASYYRSITIKPKNNPEGYVGMGTLCKMSGDTSGARGYILKAVPEHDIFTTLNKPSQAGTPLDILP